MGKKSNEKSKERRKQRKEDAQKLALASQRVKIANSVKDPMDKLMPPFRKYDRRGVCVEIQSDKALNFSPEIQQWAFDITKRNMEEEYGKEWNDREKREELLEDTAWYLVAMTPESSQPVAFVHYRFDIDYDADVLYCYELQVEREYQRKGLGRFLMQICEMLAFQSEMSKVVLTVFKTNSGAQAFYRNTLGYVEDDTSPDLFEEARYDILSKPIKVKRTQS